MKKDNIICPSFELDAFNCPHCGAYSRQYWYTLSFYAAGTRNDTKWKIAICEHCKNYSIWFKETDSHGIQFYPTSTIVEPPNEDLNDGIKRLYNEAAEIKDKSPRAAAALLRLALQELCKQLGEKGKDINYDIAELVQKGLTPYVQKALDSVRVVGNNAVHPGQIDFDDNQEIVNALFGIINFIANQTITRQKEIDSFYENLPSGARQAIEKRNKKA